MWNKKKFVLVALLVAGMSSLASAAITGVKDSADFTWKYELDGTAVFPDDSDLDSNSVGDFNEQIDAGASITLSGGQLHFSSPASGQAAYYYSGWGAGSKLWDVITDLDLENGVTVEMRVKVLAADEGNSGVVGIGIMPDGTNVDGKYYIAKTAQYWGEGGSQVTLGSGTYDNTDGYHNFRVALDPDTNTYSVWRDLELLASGLGDTDSRDNLRRLVFGNFASSVLKGDVDVDYFRLTSGAYAPIPEPATIGLLLSGGLVCLLRRR